MGALLLFVNLTACVATAPCKTTPKSTVAGDNVSEPGVADGVVEPVSAMVSALEGLSRSPVEYVDVSVPQRPVLGSRNSQLGSIG